MSIYKRGQVYWYKFYFDGALIRETAKTASKTVAKKAEDQRRRELEEGYNNIRGDARGQRTRTVKEVAGEYVAGYRLRHRSVTFIEYAVGHVVRILGSKMLVDITDQEITAYQTTRLEQKAAPKTINEEVGVLLRLLGERGDAIRVRLRRQKTLKLAVQQTVGKAFSGDEKERMLAAAATARSPFIFAALTMALKLGLRDSEIRGLTWSQINWESKILTVVRSKTAAGEGRTIPILPDVEQLLLHHSQWYTGRFGTALPEWYLFPFGRANKLDPSRPITTLKTAWSNVRRKAGVSGRWHDARHTCITELAESGAGDETIMDIAGHVSRQMLPRYSHIRIEAKRRAMEAAARGAERSVAAPAESPTLTITPGTTLN